MLAISKIEGIIKDNLTTKFYASFSYRVNYICTGSQKHLKNSKIAEVYAEFYNLYPAIFHKTLLNRDLSKVMVFSKFPRLYLAIQML